jgi:hypothetical protein
MTINNFDLNRSYFKKLILIMFITPVIKNIDKYEYYLVFNVLELTLIHLNGTEESLL